MTTKTTKAAELLLEYKQHLETQVLELRARACELAAKAREIGKLIPAEQVQEVEEQKEANEAWSFSNMPQLTDVLKVKAQ